MSVVLSRHSASVEKLAATFDGRFVLSSCAGSVLKVFEMSTGTSAFTVRGSSIRALAASGGLAAIAEPDGVRRINVLSGDEMPVLTGVQADWLGFSADGAQLAAVSGEGHVRVSRAMTGRITGAFDLPAVQPRAACTQLFMMGPNRHEMTFVGPQRWIWVCDLKSGRWAKHGRATAEPLAGAWVDAKLALIDRVVLGGHRNAAHVTQDGAEAWSWDHGRALCAGGERGVDDPVTCVSSLRGEGWLTGHRSGEVRLWPSSA